MTSLADLGLEALPAEEEILAEVRRLTAKMKPWDGVTANQLARRLGVRGGRRAGNGAVKGSWSGTMSASLRISPRLRSMARRGLLEETYNTRDYRHEYRLPSG